MFKNPHTRRVVAISIMVVGGLLMFFAPEIWQGAIVLAFGIALELIGIALEHGKK